MDGHVIQREEWKNAEWKEKKIGLKETAALHICFVAFFGR